MPANKINMDQELWPEQGYYQDRKLKSKTKCCLSCLSHAVFIRLTHVWSFVNKSTWFSSNCIESNLCQGQLTQNPKTKLIKNLKNHVCTDIRTSVRKNPGILYMALAYKGHCLRAAFFLAWDLLRAALTSGVRLNNIGFAQTFEI